MQTYIFFCKMQICTDKKYKVQNINPVKNKTKTKQKLSKVHTKHTIQEQIVTKENAHT